MFRKCRKFFEFLFKSPNTNIKEILNINIY